VKIRRLELGEIDAVRPLWLDLLEHHRSVTPQMTVRAPEDSWQRRRAEYERWLADPGSFAVLAEQDGEPLGYALVHVTDGDDTWDTGDRLAELESLSVAPAARGRGVGTALLDAVDEELERLGVTDLFLGVVASNTDAVRFYERRGLRRYLTVMHRRR
jgi:ribosomal protein S18 acetylase RimI-like enzyme